MLFAAAAFFLPALPLDALGRLPPCAALPCRNRTRSENLPRRLTAAAAALLLVACLAPQSVSAAGGAAVPAQEEVKAEAPAPNPAAAGHPLPVIVVRNGAEERSGRMHVKMTLRPAGDQTAATQADLTATVMMAAIMAMEETRAHTVAVTLIAQLALKASDETPLARAVFIPDGRSFDGKSPSSVWPTLEAAPRGFTAKELEYLRLRAGLRSRYQTPDGLTDEASLQTAIARHMGIKKDSLRPPRNECQPVRPVRVEGVLDVRG